MVASASRRCIATMTAQARPCQSLPVRRLRTLIPLPSLFIWLHSSRALSSGYQVSRQRIIIPGFRVNRSARVEARNGSPARTVLSNILVMVLVFLVVRSLFEGMLHRFCVERQRITASVHPRAHSALGRAGCLLNGVHKRAAGLDAAGEIECTEFVCHKILLYCHRNFGHCPNSLVQVYAFHCDYASVSP